MPNPLQQILSDNRTQLLETIAQTIHTALRASYVQDDDQRKPLRGDHRRPGRRGLDSGRGQYLVHAAGGERLLGRRLRQPQNRMAGRYQWANPEDQLPGSGRISWNAEPVRRSQGMLKRVLVVVTGAAGGGRAYSQYMSRVMPVSGASHRTFSASTLRTRATRLPIHDSCGESRSSGCL